ncbi:hypothetical protein GOP47_0011643 [Adiantum capillus-veneris]|uniref:Uncharacterized protein n=1 Tax=Adiantum capillus-veneris TaxID=13818 RepID=A0A9D4ZHV4_ADICA|nr:hypothetical protein GOP47_0011643 [Adiantum capillus-veneris]
MKGNKTLIQQVTPTIIMRAKVRMRLHQKRFMENKKASDPMLIADWKAKRVIPRDTSWDWVPMRLGELVDIECGESSCEG